MPLFDFTCPTCGHEFEELVFNDTAPVCPQCGGKETVRKVSMPSPLKTGAFPFKPGPVRPLFNPGFKAGSCAAGSCPHSVKE